MLLAAVCALPVLASYLAYYVWQPSGRANYGELIGPSPLPRTALPPAADQQPLAAADFDGLWTLLYAGPAECAAACAEALHTLRQVRLAQGKDSRRIGRVWLQTGAGNAATLPAEDADGLRIGRLEAGTAQAWLAALPDAASGAHIYLIDPLGNAMMRFPPRADAARMVKDLQRLLKYSALGR
ncbi:hypothetical protein E6O51_19560 [Pseudothauera rhizosphaerae]|uniref:Cytochrome oxidase Cu insertion factor, SCO1/SenC/PrrC family n=1 Tax=Pseudothauera rhizosphaerae TaxID=2565932 RepID=A0A4S4AC82_9RHOO|nr:hypothetical protein E6O51_19560 [Pseudothauera rhizosphaerae]